MTAEIEGLARPRHEAGDELVDDMRGLYLWLRADFSASSTKMRAGSWIPKTCFKVVPVLWKRCNIDRVASHEVGQSISMRALRRLGGE